jgi:hypothetical protein
MTCRNCKTTIRHRDQRTYCVDPRSKVGPLRRIWFCGPCGDNYEIVDRVMGALDKKAKGK